MQHFVAEDSNLFWYFWQFFGDFQTTKICLDSKPSAEYSAKSDWRRLWSRRQKRQIGSCENSSVATIFSWFFWSFQYFLPVFKCPFRWFLKRPSVKVLTRPKTQVLIQSNQATPSFCVTSGRRGGHDFRRTESKVERGINAFAEGVADNPTAIFVIKVNLKFCSSQ